MKQNHWEECKDCKQIKSGSLKAHTYTNYTDNKDGTHSAKCSVCNYELTEAHPEDCEFCKQSTTTPGGDGEEDKPSTDNPTDGEDDPTDGEDDPTDGKDDPKDNTVIDDEKLPETGVSSVIIIAIITLGAVLAINAFKTRKYKDI